MFGIRVLGQPVHDLQVRATDLPRPRDLRDPRVAELLARLDIATGQRNGPATQRIIADLLATSDGEWLARQLFSAGMRAVARELSDSA